MRILVIDDDEFFAENVCAYIGRFQSTTLDRASCAKSGLEKFARNEYDLVITDVFLPDCHSSKWLVEFSKQKPEQPIIVVSSQDISLEYGLAEKINLIGYFEKPFDLQILVNLISQLNQNSIKL